jgi:23S rRNA (adenine2503-C2)-methyltransferase
MVKKNLFGLTADEISDLIEPYGYSPAQAVLVANSIYKKCISDILKLQKIPKGLKEVLNEIGFIGRYLPVLSEISTDNSVKYLFRSAASKEFETVFIPEKKKKYSLCLNPVRL